MSCKTRLWVPVRTAHKSGNLTTQPCIFAGFDASKLNLTLPFEPLGSRPFIPMTNPFVWPADAGTCNLGMPNGPRVFERFIWVIKFFTRNGFVVVVDNHLVADPTAVNDPAMWVTVRTKCSAPEVSVTPVLPSYP